MNYKLVRFLGFMNLDLKNTKRPFWLKGQLNFIKNLSLFNNTADFFLSDLQLKNYFYYDILFTKMSKIF